MPGGGGDRRPASGGLPRQRHQHAAAHGLLLTGVVKERRIQTVSRFLVTNMGLFFIPSLVGTMEYVEVLRAQALPFLAVTFLTTPVVYLAAAWTVQLLMRRSRKEAGRHV